MHHESEGEYGIGHEHNEPTSQQGADNLVGNRDVWAGIDNTLAG
jgi:hypothetical protein